MAAPDAVIGEVRAAAYRIPTDAPEADGALAWDSMTIDRRPAPKGGRITPDLSGPCHGPRLQQADAERYAN